MRAARSPPSRPSQGPIGWLLSLAWTTYRAGYWSAGSGSYWNWQGLYFLSGLRRKQARFQVMEKDYKMIMHIIASHLFFDQVQIMLNHAVMYVTKITH